MATKTTKKSSFVTVSAGAGNPRYALKGNKLVAQGGYHRRFTLKGEIRNALVTLFRAGRPEYILAYYRHNGDVAERHSATRRGDNLEIGCHQFDATAVRKLARWTGVTIDWHVGA